MCQYVVSLGSMFSVCIFIIFCYIYQSSWLIVAVLPHYFVKHPMLLTFFYSFLFYSSFFFWIMYKQTKVTDIFHHATPNQHFPNSHPTHLQNYQLNIGWLSPISRRTHVGGIVKFRITNVNELQPWLHTQPSHPTFTPNLYFAALNLQLTGTRIKTLEIGCLPINSV